jgi:GT2 family glycosyltransferase
VLKIRNNGVIAASRNMGIRAANGEWIAFLDSDDWWKSNKLQSCLDRHPTADVIYHDLAVVRDTHGLLQRRTNKGRQVERPALIDLLVNGNALSNSSVLVRRRLLCEIGGLDESPEMVAAEDFNAWLRIARITEKFNYVPEVLGYYREHEQAMSRKDMSGPYETATLAFVDCLDEKHKRRRKTQISYLKGKYLYGSGRFIQARLKFQECLRGSDFGITLRSLYMLLRVTVSLRGKLPDESPPPQRST